MIVVVLIVSTIGSAVQVKSSILVAERNLDSTGTSSSMSPFRSIGIIAGAFSIGIAMVYYVTRVTYTTPVERVTATFSLVTISTYLGQVFTTPFISTIEVTWGSNAAVSLDAEGVVFLVLTVAAVLYLVTTHKKPGLTSKS